MCANADGCMRDRRRIEDREGRGGGEMEEEEIDSWMDG